MLMIGTALTALLIAAYPSSRSGGSVPQDMLTTVTSLPTACGYAGRQRPMSVEERRKPPGI